MLDLSRPRILVLLATAVVAFTGLPIVAGSGPKALAHRDACTAAPDSGWAPVYYRFHRACHNHDFCYATHFRGGGFTGRLRCDRVFYAEMAQWCKSRYPGSNPFRVLARSDCRAIAYVYYVSVRVAGAWFFATFSKRTPM